MTHHTRQIEPIHVRFPGIRSQRVEWCVMEGSKVVAVFADEHRAEAYRMKMDQLQRKMGVRA